MIVAEYVSSPGSTTDPSITHLAWSIHNVSRTLCGKPVGVRWIQGDETVSGLVCDCRPCKRVFERELREQAYPARPDEQAQDDQHDPQQDRATDQLEDASDHQNHRQDPQEERHA